MKRHVPPTTRFRDLDPLHDDFVPIFSTPVSGSEVPLVDGESDILRYSLPDWTGCPRLRSGCRFRTTDTMLLTDAQRNILRDVKGAISMLFEAHREQDQLRITAAMKHLEFLDSMTRFTVWEDRQ